jgi:hypothetical protein
MNILEMESESKSLNYYSYLDASFTAILENLAPHGVLFSTILFPIIRDLYYKLLYLPPSEWSSTKEIMVKILQGIHSILRNEREEEHKGSLMNYVACKISKISNEFCCGRRISEEDLHRHLNLSQKLDHLDK